MSDNVNHPHHYEGSTSVECIEVMLLFLGKKGVIYFCKGNAFKYIWRYKNKNGKEDLDKARWYINKGRKLKKNKKDLQLDALENLLNKKEKAYNIGGVEIVDNKEV